jgi:hypothetical protein
MPGGKSIVRTLVRVGEAAQTAQLTVTAKEIATTSKKLMSVSLMPDIPYDAVIRSVKNIVKRHSKLYGAHTRSKMPGIVGKRVYQKPADFVTKPRELAYTKLPKVGGAVDCR